MTDQPRGPTAEFPMRAPATIRRRTGRTALLLACGVLLAASCASTSRQTSTGVNRAVSKTSEGLDDAVSAPLNDFNLTRVPIPERLEAIKSPYEPLAETSCASIGAEVTLLTEILGPDSDAPEGPEEELGAKAGDAAAGLALGEVKSTVTGFIPFRSLIRQATGASAHERKLREAYQRGVQKRAYLKGVGASKGCAPPAAPNPDAGVDTTGAKIEYKGEAKPAEGPAR